MVPSSLSWAAPGEPIPQVACFPRTQWLQTLIHPPGVSESIISKNWNNPTLGFSVAAQLTAA